MNPSSLTPSQYAAMRVAMAWLATQVESQQLHPALIGLQLNPTLGALTFGVTDDGVAISQEDMIQSVMALLWSLILDTADTVGCTPQAVIHQIGLSVAQHEL